MHKFMLAAGVAALAIAAPAAAKPDKRDGERAQAAKVERGAGANAKSRAQNRGGEARANRDAERSAARTQQRGGGDARAQRRSGQEMRLATMQARGNSEARARGNDRGEVRARGNATAHVAEDRRGNNRAEARARGNDRGEVRARGNANSRVAEDRRGSDHAQQQRLRDRDWEGQRGQARDRDRERLVLRDDRRGDWDDHDRWTRAAALGLVNGCPPGLAKKNNGCLPPGQAKKLIGSVIPAAYASQRLPRELRYFYPESDSHYYRYGDGYAYRVDRQSNLVSALLPLIGAALGIGQPFPSTSSAYRVPSYYQSFYPTTDRYDYRYANGYMYEIDLHTGLIADAVPMYDRGYGVGQMLPASYSHYNVPYPYRDQYADGDDYYYRYAPGAIYQVDQQTNLITTIAALLSGGLGLGQQLPVGYDAYNVPFSYRDRYYDTPDSWYRYADGNIYQVDPTTRLITAIVQAIV